MSESLGPRRAYFSIVRAVGGVKRARFGGQRLYNGCPVTYTVLFGLRRLAGTTGLKERRVLTRRSTPSPVAKVDRGTREWFPDPKSASVIGVHARRDCE